MRKSFSSRIERHIAWLVLGVIILPMALISQLAVDQVRRESLTQAELRLTQLAKDYGMVIADRIRRDFDKQIELDKPVVEVSERRPKLRIDRSGRLTLTSSQLTKSLDFHRLIADVEDIANIQRCVDWIGGQPCTEHDSTMYVSKSWTLRLIGVFDTEIEIVVHVAQSRSMILNQMSLMTRLLPYWVTLIACLAVAIAMVLLRRRLRAVPTLTNAVKQIEAGQYGTAVRIDTNDEFELLGNALNGLSARLRDAFGYRHAITGIDEMVLNATPISDSCEAICEVALRFSSTRSAVIKGRIDHLDGKLIGHLDSAIEASALDAHTTEHLAQLDILNGDEVWGWLLVDQQAANDTRIRDLAQKASVAVSHAKRSEALYQQATFDDLTGLLNRNAFTSELTRAVERARRSSGMFALAYLDLDDFKRVNDTQGHTAGDAMLRTAGSRLQQAVRETDVVARLGGDEFAILFNDLGDDVGLVTSLERILSKFQEPITVNSRNEYRMACSIGVCILNHDGDTVETLLSNADLAMYQAKAKAGAGYVFFDQEYNAVAERRMLIENRLRQAILNKTLTIALQPKLDIKSGTLTTMEALARWHDEELGTVSPDEFVGVAESAGLIVDLTELVIEQVAGVVHNAQDDGWRIAINISPAQIAQIGFVDWFIQTLQRFDLDPLQVEVEVTESLLIEDPDRAQKSLQALRDHGLRLSLDDFGTGFSSLSMLTQLRLDALKLDKSFIDAIPEDPQSMVLVQKIVEIAKALHMDIVAEGVETTDQLNALKAMGCTHIQGYLISAPVSTTDIGNVVYQRDNAQNGSQLRTAS